MNPLPLELPDDPVLVSGDEHRLHQVLANVLSNAGKHTPDGATVTVRVGDAVPGAPRSISGARASCASVREESCAPSTSSSSSRPCSSARGR